MPGQTRFKSSPLVTSDPSASSKTSSRSKARVPSSTGWPSLSNCRRRSNTRNRLNSSVASTEAGVGCRVTIDELQQRAGADCSYDPIIGSPRRRHSLWLRHQLSRLYPRQTRFESQVFQLFSAARTFWIALSRVKGGTGDVFRTSQYLWTDQQKETYARRFRLQSSRLITGYRCRRRHSAPKSGTCANRPNKFVSAAVGPAMKLAISRT